MKYFNLLIIAIATFVLQSCGTSKVIDAFHPYESHHYSQMSELICLGEVEVDVEYSSYLWGLITNVEKVNGKDYDSQNTKSLAVSKSFLKSDRHMDKAYAKAYEKYPSAVYYQVVRSTKESQNLFLGSQVKRTATVRCYGFKK